MKTFAYVDGFNLYYRALKGRAGKWLDLCALIEAQFPKIQLEHVRYFTARVKPFPDQNVGKRQALYLRALSTLQRVSIHYGRFAIRQNSLPLVSDYKKGNFSNRVDVMKPEEKGTDVNLASYLVHDAHLSRFDLAIVVSNDSDLVKPVELVVTEVGLPVWVLNPDAAKRPGSLQRCCSRYMRIDRKKILSSQLPLTLSDSRGTISKPPAW